MEDVEILCKTLQFEHKLFYFDLKENPRGRYLKISEKTSAARSTIIVPANGIAWFVDLFDYYINADDRDLFSKELKLDNKVFYFDVGENKRGRFLKVAEASVSRNRSTIIIPAGSSGEEGWDGWAAFRNILLEIIDEASRDFSVPNQQHMDTFEHLAKLSDDVGDGFISGHNDEPYEEMSNLSLSKVMRADHKRFFFDLGNNNRGHFLRISELAGVDRSSIILPLSGLNQFHEIIGHFVEITKDNREAMACASIRTIEPLPR